MIGGVLWVIYFVKDSWLEYDKKLEKAITTKKEETKEDSFPDHHWLLIDLLPILTPIILISLGAFIHFDPESVVGILFNFISLPLIAVLIGAFIAIFQLKRLDRRNTINRLVEQAILKSALVIMITGAGGALGFVIRETGIQE